MPGDGDGCFSLRHVSSACLYLFGTGKHVFLVKMEAMISSVHSGRMVRVVCQELLKVCNSLFAVFLFLFSILRYILSDTPRPLFFAWEQDKRVFSSLIFVIRENEILISVIRDSLLFRPVNRARDPPSHPVRPSSRISQSGDADFPFL